jgi:uncharacterized protein YraI
MQQPWNSFNHEQCAVVRQHRQAAPTKLSTGHADRRALTGLFVVGLLLLAIVTGLPAQGKSNARPAAQAFDAAATVTALVQTRTAILAIVTRTPDIPGISAGSPVNATEALVEVIVAGLNVRSGPGTNYAVVNSAQSGAQFQILGQADNCSWLQIGAVGTGQSVGWIAGAAQYATFARPCAAIPAAAIPATPTPRPAPTATPPPAQNATAQGCYILRNELGFAVTITLNGPNGWQDTLQLAVGAEREYCAPAGTYQYTLTAPAPWGSIRGDLAVKANERLLLPLKFGN